jgi:uncharacterized 2Fe-2S/4Fe-4S cluster protein (DUF4445 family)
MPKPLSDVKIDIPPESLTTPQRLQIEGLRSAVEIDPPIVVHDLEIERANLNDLRSDFSRLSHKLISTAASISMDLSVMSELPGVLRENGWKVRVVLRGNEVVAVFPPETPIYGLAVDIGTTKLAAYLVDLLRKDGRLCGRA